MWNTTLDSERLKNFSPLSGLKPEHLTNLVSKIAVQKLDAGHYLFKQKATDRFNVYLLSGSVELRSGDQVLTTIKGGSDEAAPVPRR